MAVTQNTLIGRTRGSIGGVTFSSWKGLNVAKGKAENVQQPNTDAQLLQRSKMALTVNMYRAISSIVKTGFASMAVNMSEFNAFTSYNIKNAVFALTPTTAGVLYPQVVIARGTLTETPISTVSGLAAATDVNITYPATLAAPDQSLLDLSLAAVFNETSNEVNFLGGGSVRGDGSVDIPLTSPLASADILHVYLFFENENGTMVSDSVYATSVVV